MHLFDLILTVVHIFLRNKCWKYNKIGQEVKDLEEIPETNKEDLVKCPLCEKLVPKSSKLEHAKTHVKTEKSNS